MTQLYGGPLDGREVFCPTWTESIQSRWYDHCGKQYRYVWWPGSRMWHYAGESRVKIGGAA